MSGLMAVFTFLGVVCAGCRWRSLAPMDMDPGCLAGTFRNQGSTLEIQVCLVPTSLLQRHNLDCKCRNDGELIHFVDSCSFPSLAGRFVVERLFVLFPPLPPSCLAPGLGATLRRRTRYPGLLLARTIATTHAPWKPWKILPANAPAASRGLPSCPSPAQLRPCPSQRLRYLDRTLQYARPHPEIVSMELTLSEAKHPPN